jgi:hypothetical protein
MAEYVETLLAPGETIVTNARQHWAALIRFALQPILILGLAFLGLILGMAVGEEGFFRGIIDTVLGLATAALFIVAAVWLPIQALRWTSRRFVLTSRRVIRSDGLMRRTSIDASLDKITDISYRQTFMGARLGYGDLEIATASNSPLDMRELRAANEFKKSIMVAQETLIKDRARSMMGGSESAAITPAVAAVLGGPVGTVAPAVAEVVAEPAAPVVEVAKASSPTEITAMLASLTDMKEDGTITEADFEAKKKELLERL